MKQKIKIAVAGSTQHSLACAQVLAEHKAFSLLWTLTAQPKKIGRKQVLTPSPLQKWSKQQKISNLQLKKKVDELKAELFELQKSQPIDYLLVVDFGYLIPDWLLDLPKKAALNLHPSALPAWRGSAPGQYALLHGDQTSSLSLIRLIDQLDAGPIIVQQKFEINNNWTSQDYYQHSFQLAQKLLPNWILTYDSNQLQEEPQPEVSPTPLAERLTKQDAFLDWQIIEKLMQGNWANLEKMATSNKPASTLNGLDRKYLLSKLLLNEPVKNWPAVVERACRAFQPWPVLWTQVPTTKDKKRMQILTCRVAKTGELVLEQVKLEGLQTTLWSEIKNKFAN